MIIPPIREFDRWGSGAYKAKRSKLNDDGVIEYYEHAGVDYCAYPKSILISDYRAIVKRIGFPYSLKGDRNEYRLIELEVDSQTITKYMYVWPSVKAGDRIERGDTLGIVQDITKHFEGMTPHYHFEVAIEGDHTNPDIWLRNHLLNRYASK